MKVLMIVTSLCIADGVTSYAMNYFRKIDHRAIQMDFAIYNRGQMELSYIEQIKNAGSQIFCLPPFSKLHEHYRECKKIIEAGQYDVVHDNSLIITCPIMLAAKSCKVPVRILHSHSSKMGENRLKEIRNKIFLPFLKAMATDYMSCSGMAGRAMFGRKGFTVAPNVVNAEKYRFDKNIRMKVRKEMNATGKYVVLTVGRIVEQKNPLFAMDVFKQYAEEDLEAEYWWVGSGCLDEQLKDYVDRIGIKEKVKLLGNREDVDRLYQAADCFFLPSLFEGLPVSGVEAQASGLPCVVSDTVTEELAYTDFVEFVPLTNKKMFCRSLKRQKNRKRERSAGYELFLESVFSDSSAGEQLRSWYENFLMA